MPRPRASSRPGQGPDAMGRQGGRRCSGKGKKVGDVLATKSVADPQPLTALGWTPARPKEIRAIFPGETDRTTSDPCAIWFFW
eukprot:3746284-Pyramimonas_sp.AAC.1